jgi:hypothetical protein
MAAFGMVVHDVIACPKITDPTGRRKSYVIATGIAVVRGNCVHSDGVSFASGNTPSNLPVAGCKLLQK